MTAGDELVLGIDLGTQSTRAGLFRPDGELIAIAARSQTIDTPRPGWSEQDPHAWWENSVMVIREVLDASGGTASAVRAVACGGQMHGPVPLRADGSIAGDRVQLWNDQRCAAAVEELQRSPAHLTMLDVTANAAAASWTGFKIQWLRQHEPALAAETWKFLVPKDFINFRLTDVAATDLSEASGSYLLDSRTLRWSSEAAAILGVDLGQLPDPTSSADVIGTVTPAASAETGLLAGTPVVAGGGDMLCTLLGSGLWRRGAASDITGTSSILSTLADAPRRDPRIMNLHHVVDGWVPFGLTSCGGLSLRWYVDHFLGGGSTDPTVSIDDGSIERLVGAVGPGAEGLLFLPYLLGERRLGSPHSRGAIVGITARHRAGAICRAIMEGVTFELRRALEIIESGDRFVDEIAHSGGGASSDAWSQIKADIYQRPVSTVNQRECGLFGAAALAAAGARLFPDPVSAANEGLRTVRVFEPNALVAELYDELYDVFVDVHDRLQDPFERLTRSRASRPISQT